MNVMSSYVHCWGQDISLMTYFAIVDGQFFKSQLECQASIGYMTERNENCTVL
jgi:hypothetical protein